MLKIQLLLFCSERDDGKKDVASDLIKKAARPPGLDITFINRLNKLKNRSEPKDDNNNLSPPPSPPPRPPPTPPQPPSSFSQS